MKNKNATGWIVAAILGVALSGVLIFQFAGGGASRTAAIGSSGQGEGPPAEVAEDIQRIKDAKDQNSDRNGFARVPPGQEANRVDANPEHSCDPSLSPNVIPEWRNVAKSLTEANGRASQIYVATVENVIDGAPLVAQAPTEGEGRVETPTQRITLRVDQRVKGRGPDQGDTLTIESLGDGQRGCYRVAGDPPYQRGEQYLLLLEDGRGGRPAHTFSPEGRWRVTADGTLAGMDHHSDRMADVAGAKLETVVSKLRSP